MKRLIIAGIAVGLLAVLIGAAPRSYAATVDGARITRNDVENHLAAQARVEKATTGSSTVAGPVKDTFTSAGAAPVVAEKITNELVRRELVRRKIEVSPKVLANTRKELIAEMGTLPQRGAGRPQRVFDLLNETFQQSYVGAIANELRLRSALAGMTDNTALELICLNQIVIEDVSRAAELRARITSENFGEVADQISPDQSGRRAGGRAGCFPPEAFAEFGPEVEGAVLPLAPGEVSGVVQVQESAAIFQVSERGPKRFGTLTISERHQLLAPVQQKFDALILRLARKADIKVDPRYGTLQIGGRGGAVTVEPPKAPRSLDPVPSVPAGPQLFG